jgi:hypothetical protein
VAEVSLGSEERNANKILVGKYENSDLGDTAIDVRIILKCI